MAWEQHSHADGETFTADDMNRMEEAIYDGGGYTSKKNWEDGNVPSVENWNRLENGILAIGSDKVSENLLFDSKALSKDNLYAQSNWELTQDSDGFGVWSVVDFGVNCGIYARGMLESDIDLTGKTVTFSVDVKSDGWAEDRTYFRFNPTMLGSSRLDYSDGLRIKYYRVDTLAASLIADVNGDTWTRIVYTFTFPTKEEMTDNATTEYPYLWQTVGIQMRNTNMGIYLSFRKPKLELADADSDWSPNPADLFTVKTWESEQDENNIINADNANRWEQGITDMLDYREKYATEETETANPQSIPDDTEDSDEVAAPEAEEIE